MKQLLKKIKNYIYERTFRSKTYWENRYKKGGNSGSGSYNDNAEFKAKIINEFIEKYSIDTLLDLGCGDGNQIIKINVKNYLGFDVSKTAISICKQKFDNDKTKRFFLFDKKQYLEVVNKNKPELSVSLDVIFHLVEESVFENYIKNLFAGASKYVIIFSTNYDEFRPAIHHRNRKFDEYINSNVKGWEFYKFVENPYKGNDSNADFYIYKAVNK